GDSQVRFWRRRLTWASTWRAATAIESFGRLSAFSYTEYLWLLGYGRECESLFLDDLSGSRSHRNGLCIVDGLDEYDWHDSNPSFDGRYSPELIEHLDDLARSLLAET